MFGFLLIVLLLVGIFMTVVVLLQAGKGGGLAAMGGGGGTAGDSLIGGRQAATLLTKSTWISGGLFLFLALTLSVMSSRQSGPSSSVLRGQFQAPAVAPTPVLPGTGEQPAGGAETAPGGAAPATPTPQPEEGATPPQQ